MKEEVDKCLSMTHWRKGTVLKVDMDSSNTEHQVLIGSKEEKDRLISMSHYLYKGIECLGKDTDLNSILRLVLIFGKEDMGRLINMIYL